MIVYQWPFEIAAGIYRAGLYSMLIGREPVNPLHCDLCRACGTGREPTAQQKAVAGVEVGDGLLQAGMVRSPVRLSPHRMNKALACREKQLEVDRRSALVISVRGGI